MRVSGKAENMFTPELATDRIQDLVRDVEARRLSISVRAPHADPEETTVRWLTHGLIAAERFFHVTRRKVPQELREPRLAAQAH